MGKIIILHILTYMLLPGNEKIKREELTAK
jgi:hypothetical protein